MQISVINFSEEDHQVVCSTQHGLLRGKWCSDVIPLLHHDYEVEIDIPQVITQQELICSDDGTENIKCERDFIRLSALVIEQDDNTLTLSLNGDICIVEVDSTVRESSYLNERVVIQVDEIHFYEIGIGF